MRQAEAMVGTSEGGPAGKESEGITEGSGRGGVPIMRPSLPPLQDYVDRLSRIWDTRMLSNFGENAVELEAIAQDYIGNPHIRAVSCCDIALVLGIASLDLPKGSEVIVTPFTFNSTISSILWNGLVPVFADIDGRTFNLSPEAVEEAITERTTAILATHVFGNPCAIDELQEIVDHHDLGLVFDAAHAYGSTYRGTKVGNFGDLEMFSLSGTKLVTSGEGGLIATARRDLVDTIEHLRNFGFMHDYNSKYLGLNGKISELNAALGCLTLGNIDRAIGRRAEIVRLYKELLGDGVGYQEVEIGCRSAYKDFCILLPPKDRSRAEAALGRAGVQTKRYFLPLHKMDAFAHLSKGPLPVTEEVYSMGLCVPIFNEMDDDTVRYISQLIRSATRS